MGHIVTEYSMTLLHQELTFLFFSWKPHLLCTWDSSVISTCRPSSVFSKEPSPGRSERGLRWGEVLLLPPALGSRFQPQAGGVGSGEFLPSSGVIPSA